MSRRTVRARGLAPWRHRALPAGALPGHPEPQAQAGLERGVVVRHLAQRPLDAHLERLRALRHEPPARVGDDAVLGARCLALEPAPRRLQPEVEGEPRRDPLVKPPPEEELAA